MKLTVLLGNIIELPAQCLAVFHFEKEPKLTGTAAAIDWQLNGLLTRIVSGEKLRGTLGEARMVDTHRKIPAKRILLLGLGKKDQLSTESFRVAGATIVKQAKQVHAETITTELPLPFLRNIPVEQASQALVEGARLADYEFTKYKSQANQDQPKPTEIKELTIVDKNEPHVERLEDGVKKGLILAAGAMNARDLVNEPPSVATPRYLVEVAESIAESSEGIGIKIFDRRQLKHLGAEALLTMTRGSKEPSYLIHLIYQPNEKISNSKFPAHQQQAEDLAGGQIPNKSWKVKVKLPKVALVGKGVTFDAGGLGLKPWQQMVDMKLDMAGAASVLGVFSVLPRLKPKVEVHGIIATGENMIGPDAVKPGEVVKSLSGKTIEIKHTDAEGRVMLADALTYALQQKLDYLVDLATLTGACMVALGAQHAGVFTNNEALQTKFLSAARAVDEKMWPLPILDHDQDELKSEVADLSNAHQTKYGGASLGAMFLKEFVGDTPWVHIDMAGPAFAEKPFNAHTPKGGTGFGVRTILTWLLGLTDS